MRQAKVKSYRSPRKPLRLGRGVGRFFRMMLRGLIPLLPFLPLMAIVMVFLLPQTPHLRISYTYTGPKEHPRYITCDYVGVYGLAQKVFGQECPLISFMGKGREP